MYIQINKNKESVISVMINFDDKTGDENIHQNIVSLRRMLKLSQSAFIEKYLSDEDGVKMMSNSKYSNFERFGGEDSGKIASVIAEKIGVEAKSFCLDPDAFVAFAEIIVKTEEQTENHSFATGQNSQVEQLVRILSDYISNAIMEGEYKLGDKLPSDRDLAAKFGVGRTALREALKVLSVLGLIDIRPGQGTFICKNTSNFFLMPLSWSFFVGDDQVDNMIEVRNVLEQKSAQLAAQNATEEDLEFLTNVYENSKQAYNDGNFKDFLDYDMEFHLAIARCSHNPVIQNLLFTSRSLIRQISKSGMLTLENLRNIYVEHGIIYDAIKNKDSYGASQKMISHLINSCTRYQLPHYFMK